MPDELKVGDVVMVECHCSHCQRLGPPDPGEHNGPFVIKEITPKGQFLARAPFGIWRSWGAADAIKVKVVGRADETAA